MEEIVGDKKQREKERKERRYNEIRGRKEEQKEGKEGDQKIGRKVNKKRYNSSIFVPRRIKNG